MKDLVTVWKVKIPNKEEKLDKMANYFEVERIIKYKRRQGKRAFFVSWKNYGEEENSWVDEEDMDGCLDLMQDFLLTNNLEFSKITGLMGSSATKDVNKLNWCSMEQILEWYYKFKNEYFDSVKLDAKEWDGFGNEDCLFFLRLNNHAYVILYYATERIGYIADGTNNYLNNIDDSIDIRKALKIKLIGCTYEQQNRIDYCASSAVLIALELTKAYGKNEKNEHLISPKQRRERIIRTLHKFESQPLDNSTALDKRQFVYCPKCGKKYYAKQRRNLHMHQIKCSIK